MSPVLIRAARESDLAVMQEIERSAGSLFREIGMPEIAEDEPLALEELDRYRQQGRAWVAADDADVPVAYLEPFTPRGKLGRCIPTGCGSM
jgi:hypothetical protein